MLKRFLFAFVALVLSLTSVMPATAATSLQERLSGRILLQVEEHGEAWYVNPVDQNRYYMGRPSDAFAIMRSFGLGATNADLNKIPIGLIRRSGRDSDNDGLTDLFEYSQGTNTRLVDTDGDGYSDLEEILNEYSPLNPAPEKIYYNPADAERLAGRILLQVESAGEAWYVNPVDNRRYYLGRPADAFTLMRTFGLGITNADLNTMPSGSWQGEQIPAITPEPEPAAMTYNVFNNDPLFTIAYPNTWLIGANSTVDFHYSYLGEYPSSRIMLNDADESILMNVESLVLDSSETLADRVSIMRHRYLQDRQTKRIVDDINIRVDGHDASMMSALQYTNRGYVDMYTTIVEVKPGAFIAVNGSIMRDSATYNEDVALYIALVSTLKINDAQWNKYYSYRVDVPDHISMMVASNWSASTYEFRENAQEIDSIIQSLLDRYTTKDFDQFAFSMGMSPLEALEGYKTIQDSQFTDLIYLHDSDYKESMAIVRSTTANATKYDDNTMLELLAYNAYHSPLRGVAEPFVKRSSKLVSVDGYRGVQESYTRALMSGEEQVGTIYFTATRVRVSDNTVYSFIHVTRLDDQSLSNYDSLLQSVDISK